MDHQQSVRKQTMNSSELARASEEFDTFCNATTLKSILGHFRHLCELLKIRPNTVNQFYPKLKAKLRSWKAQALWKKFDQRANHKCYNRGKACPNARVLIIGGGPCGLRSAIEAQLLGAKVVVVEKRDRMSRNNVLHLWPFVIQDLRGLGAKKFFGKFCAGSIDHISIRQLQCILLKVALILGVEFHESVSFDSLIPPPENQEEDKIGWRAKTTPTDHPVSQYEFDVLIGADGKRNTLEGFKRKEFRGKLAIAITANFINKRTEAEARVEEISGVAFIFNQKFFKELYQETGIDLENIVYYKDDTHYFVMTAKKHSLIDKGVILQDHADTAKLLAKENVDREALMLYAREAAEFSTEYQMTDMEFAVNHYGQPDVAMFDFTSMYAAENASRILERRGHKLLMILVGDSLLEPFWPTGSGCARGFLSSMDACWAIKEWGANISPLEVIAERESIYRLLGQTTPENLNRDYAAYTLDPHTRYPNLNVSSVTPIQVRSLLDTDDPDSIKHPPVPSEADIPKKRRRRDLRGDTQVHPDTLLRWLQKQVALYDSVQVEDMGASFKNGLAICAIIHRYRPDLIEFHSLNPDDIVTNNQLAFDILEKELGIPPIMTGEEMAQCEVPDKLAMFSYLTQLYEVFRGEIPHIKHPKLYSVSYATSRNEHLQSPEYPLTSQINSRPRKSNSTFHGNHTPSCAPDRRTETFSHPVPPTYFPQTTVESFDHNNNRVSLNANVAEMGDSFAISWITNKLENVKVTSSLKEIVEPSNHFNRGHECCRLENSKVNEEEPENEERPIHKQSSQLTPEQKVQLIDRIARHDSATRARHSRSRHSENFNSSDKKGDTVSRRSRKRRSTEKMGATVEERQKRLADIEKNRAERMRRRQYLRYMATQQFYKSMQMLQANAKREKDEPFEDYSIFLYRQTAPDFKDRVKYLEQKILYPDREPKIHAGHRKNSIDEEFSGRIKSIEDKLKGSTPAEKKPRDLLRAIGKIEKTDWNVKEIEKKIEENKMGRLVRHERVERVPKWSREQFLARQIKMEKKGRDQKETDSKYADIDNTLKNIDRKIKEGNVLGHNKVSAMAEQFSNKNQDAEPKVQKSNIKPTITLPTQGGSEMCHFCNKRVYLMERLSAEGKFFHRGCFRCEYCSTSLRIGNHTFDRDKSGGRFYCTQHFGFPGTIKARAEKKRITSLNKENIPTTPVNLKTPEKAKLSLEGVVGLDLLDRGQTPERIEFENLAEISDAEEPQSQMDEDEWTDRNFGASTAEMGSSDDISEMSDSDDDNEVFEEAIDQPLTTEGTLELAKNWTLRYSHPQAGMGQSDTGSNEYEDSSDEYTNEDDESTTATEDEDEIRARELRKQEVWLKNPTRSSDTDSGSETEVKTSQDSVDNITQELLVLPLQTPNLVSQETDMNNSEITVDRDVINIGNVQCVLKKETLTDNTLVNDTNEQIEEDVKFDGGNVPENEVCGSIIPFFDFPLNLPPDIEENNITEPTPLLITYNKFNNSLDECASEYGSSIKESNLSKLNKHLEHIPNDLSSESNQSNLEFNNNSRNELSNEVVTNNEKLKSTMSDNTDLIQMTVSGQSELNINNKVFPIRNITPSEKSNILNTELQTEFAGIVLPDAIPFTRASYNNTIQPHIEQIANFKEQLPDLITSSPSRSRASSPSSSSEKCRSTETVYDELYMSDNENKMTSEGSEVYDSDNVQKFNESTSYNVNENDDKLKLSIGDTRQIPIVTITSPSPTNEKSLEEVSLKIAKLTIPEEPPSQLTEPDRNSSYSKLKQDLRLRKAKNKISIGELRPLSAKNAREKMNKYFTEETKPKTTDQNVAKQSKEFADIKVIDLDIKPKLSAKVEAKDMMKYFQKTEQKSIETLNPVENVNKIPTISRDDCDININIDELNVTDTNSIDEEFEQIEQQGHTLLLTINQDVEPKLENVHIEGTSSNLIKSKQSTSTITPNVKFTELEGEYVIDENKNLRNVPQVELHKGTQNTIDNHDERSVISGQKVLTLGKVNNNSETKLCEDINISSSKDSINTQLINFQYSSNQTSKLHNGKSKGIFNSADNFTNNPKRLVQSPQFNNVLLNEKNDLHKSDSILNMKTETANTADILCKTQLSKSSSALVSLPAGCEQITKVKVVQQNIETPKQVHKVDINTDFCVINKTSKAPNRPERKHELNSSPKFVTSSTQLVPDIPARRKSSKIKSNIQAPMEKSTSNVQLNSIAINERLTASDTTIDKCKDRINIGTNSLKHSMEIANSNSTSKRSKIPVNITDRYKHSHSTQFPPFVNSDQCEPAKTLPPKYDRGKKDKCVVS